MLGTFFKKIKGVYEEVIGTATVVAPEVVVNKQWDPSSDEIGNAMKVPSKHFYDYLGPYICTDEALRNGPFKNELGEETVGFGLGHEPYNNDLGKALDRKVFSSPAPMSFTIDYSDEGETDVFRQDVTTKSKTFDKSNSKYKNWTMLQEFYQWLGDWGDTENGFETSVTLKVQQQMRCDRVPGNVFGDLTPTGAFGVLFIGPSNDDSPVEYDSGYNRMGTPIKGFKKFYNQYFSTGHFRGGNDSFATRVYIVTIYRKPYDTSFLIRGHAAARGGQYDPLFSPIGCSIPDPGVGIPGNGSVTVPVGSLVCGALNLIFKPIIDILNAIIAFIFGLNTDNYVGSMVQEVDVISRTFMSIDKKEWMTHPAQTKFYPTATTATPPTIREYFHTQFYYPYVNKNPLYAFTDTFNYKEPYLNNKVVENTMYNDKVQIEHPLVKKYKYFVPSLFSLLYETNIGVFYEQLSKQLSGQGIPQSLHIKLQNHLTPSEPGAFTKKQEACLFDAIFPTNESIWNSYLEDTGWTNAGKCDAGFLGNFISGATVPATPNSGLPADYSSALGDYGITASIAEAENVIGEFSFIKSQVEACGGDLAAWTESCNLHCYELSTGTPKNLALKLAQFIVWYLEPNGIAEQTRMSAKSLIDYEKLVDGDIIEYRNSSDAVGGIDFKQYHIVGTDIYPRNCV